MLAEVDSIDTEGTLDDTAAVEFEVTLVVDGTEVALDEAAGANVAEELETVLGVDETGTTGAPETAVEEAGPEGITAATLAAAAETPPTQNVETRPLWPQNKVGSPGQPRLQDVS
jgi:hypothetical protein